LNQENNNNPTSKDLVLKMRQALFVTSLTKEGSSNKSSSSDDGGSSEIESLEMMLSSSLKSEGYSRLKQYVDMQN
jgi:hypothetical protein